MLKNIVAECARAGIPKCALAKELNVTRNTLDSWISSERMPANQLIAVAKKFNVSVDYLVGRTDIRNYSDVAKST